MDETGLLNKADLRNFKIAFLKWYIGLATLHALGIVALIELLK